MPRDGGALDAALVAVLQADAALVALQPDGVWLDDVPPAKRRFVLVTVLEAIDEGTFDAGRAFEVVRYRVTAVGRIGQADVTTGPAVGDAAARIDAVLEAAALTVVGYPAGVTVARVGRVPPVVQPDDDDRSVRWYIRGGVYEVFAPN